jgi:hypothetical protein
MASIRGSASIDAATLGPYVSAAAAVHGPACGDLHHHLDQIMRPAMGLVLKVDTARAAAEAERPIRSFQVTGVLSVDNTRNPHRTQIGCIAASGRT